MTMDMGLTKDDLDVRARAREFREKFLFPKIFDVFIDRQRHLTLRSLKKIREEYDALQRS